MQNIESTAMVEDQLLKSIYRYYAVGAPYLTQRYIGSSLIDAALKEKLKEVQRPDSIIQKTQGALLSTLNCAVDAVDVIALPNYCFSVRIKNEKITDEFEKDLSFIISLSLLTDIYTYYFRETTFVLRNGQLLKKITVDSFSEALLDSSLIDQFGKKAETVITKYFPDKTFLSHVVLKGVKISGVFPCNVNANNYPPETAIQFSSYELLFLGDVDEVDRVLQ